jgi:hypothetical protein
MAVVGSMDYCDNVTLVHNPFTLRYPSSSPFSLGPCTLSPAVVMVTSSLSHSVSPAESKPIANFLQNRPSPTPHHRFVYFQNNQQWL